MEVIKQEEFEDKIKEGVVLVDFFATWCGPCKMLGPILEQASEELKEVKFVKADVDEVEDLARGFGIMNVPTMIIFKDGELQEKIVGLRQKNQIIEACKKYL